MDTRRLLVPVLTRMATTARATATRRHRRAPTQTSTAPTTASRLTFPPAMHHPRTPLPYTTHRRTLRVVPPDTTRRRLGPATARRPHPRQTITMGVLEAT